MQRDEEEKVFYVPFHLSCDGIMKVRGRDYQDAVDKQENKVNSYNIDQNHLHVSTLDGNEYDVPVEDCDLEYSRDYEKEDINNQMGATI